MMEEHSLRNVLFGLRRSFVPYGRDVSDSREHTGERSACAPQPVYVCIPGANDGDQHHLDQERR